MNNRKVNALVIHRADTVAVALEALESGDTAVYKLGDTFTDVSIIQSVPMYHKFAIADVKAGDNLYKYGESIGQATSDISAGEHVHTHNLVSIREGIGN